MRPVKQKPFRDLLDTPKEIQKNDEKFEANYQLSLAILDSNKNQIQHHSWQETKSVSFFEETRSEAESISTGHFFNVNSGKYSISILKLALISMRIVDIVYFYFLFYIILAI